MSFKNDYLLNVDIKHRMAIGTPTFRQGDNAILRFRIFDNNVLYDLTGFTKAEIVHELPSGDRIINFASLNDKNEIEYVYNTGLEFAEHGFVKVLLSIYSNSSVVSVQPFKIFVYDYMRSDALTYISVLQELINNVQFLEASVQQAITDVNINLVEIDILKSEFDTISKNTIQAESIREVNEYERKSNESQRIIDENIRITNESNRGGNESDRELNESSRKIEEDNRIINELSRIVNENTRQSNEITRESNEITRESNENVRIQSETQRDNVENIRLSNENDRVAKELERDTNESTRINNENDRNVSEDNRKLNEDNRIIAESQRANNELTRNTAETLRQQAYSDAKDIIDNSVSVGVFNLSTQYKKNNRVLNNGSTWIAKVDTISNHLPTLPVYENQWWILEAQRGTDGNGSVVSINGVSPDVKGNVTLTIPTDWTDINNKPTTFNPTSHNHPISQVNGLQNELDKIASETEFGHVKVDGKTIVINGNGVISSIGGGSDIKLGEVSNLTATQNDTATQFTINWTTPTANEFIKVEAYISTSDISNSDRDYCALNATKFADGKVVTGTASVINNTLYYIKVFTMYSFLGSNQYSKGVSINKLAKDITPPSPITNFTATKGNALVDLSWINPIDSDFSKTKIVYKIGSYPTSHADGTVAYEGSNTSVKVTGLINDTEYYFRAFTFDANGNINSSTTNQQVTVIPKAYVIYGVKIDTNNSNPETALTYIENSVGYTPAKGNNGNFSYGSWQDKFPFNQIKPCVVKNGVVNYYLNPNDYTKKLDGGNADITSGNDGDVMVEFPKIYWKFETIGNDLYVRYSDKQVDSAYKCLAHTRGTSEKDKIYLSAYLGFSLSSKLRSLSGRIPTVSQNISQFRTLAKASGTEYEQSTYYQLLMLQVLFIIMFKNRDSQTALGRGYVDGNPSSIATGGANAKGMFYGESTGKLQNKFCGIEDFWGNVSHWIDGMYCDASRNILLGNDNYNDTGNGYTNYGQGAVSNLNGYIDRVQGGTETGFIIKSGSGSDTTYYADLSNLTASCLPVFGADWVDEYSAGAFRLITLYPASIAMSDLSARLSCF